MTSAWNPRKPADRVCIALDASDRSQILHWARQLGPRVGWLKIGLEAFVGEGPSLVEEVAQHARVFLDLKFHDIPNTVARAVSAASRSGASLINAHASGGREMLLAAREALVGENPPLLVAVTLLTSIDSRTLADLPMSGTPQAIAKQLAVLSRQCGLDGVVCSPTDLPDIRAACGPDFLTVVPGIRPAGTSAADQRRHASPLDALSWGADILVVGRPITQAADPQRALEEMLSEIESAIPGGTQKR